MKKIWKINCRFPFFLSDAVFNISMKKKINRSTNCNDIWPFFLSDMMLLYAPEKPQKNDIYNTPHLFSMVMMTMFLRMLASHNGWLPGNDLIAFNKRKRCWISQRMSMCVCVVMLFVVDQGNNIIYPYKLLYELPSLTSFRKFEERDRKTGIIHTHTPGWTFYFYVCYGN